MHSYEDIAALEESLNKEYVVEGWRGTDLVKWQSRLLMQMQDMVDKYSKVKNQEYVDKLQSIIKTWKDNQITGSVNVEDVKILQAAAGQLAADDWKLQKYFRNVETNLRAIIASEEELPRVPEENPGPSKPTPRMGAMKEEPAGAPEQSAEPSPEPEK